MSRSVLACAALLLCAAASIHAQGAPALTSPDTSSTDTIGVRIRMPGGLIRELPVDSAEALLRLLPGFVQLESGDVSYRSASARTASYIDGVPVVRLDIDRPVTPALRSLQSISLISGGPAARAGAAAVEYTTLRAADDEWRADAIALTDALSPGDWSQRATRLELSAAGPVPGLDGLSLAVSSSLAGHQFRQFPAGTGPVYVASGVDTTITLPTNTGTADVVVPEYVSWDVRELPLGNRDRSDVTAALGYGRGDAAYAVRFYRTSAQSMTRTLEQLYNPDAWRGEDDVTQIISLSVTQPLPLGLTGEAVVSNQRFDYTYGMLAPGWANLNAQPTFGITTGSLGFVADREDWPVTDAVINALRSGVLPVDELSLTTIDDPVASTIQGIPGVNQALRLNPYAMRNDFPISGLGGSSEVALSWSKERHWYGRGRVLRSVGSYQFGMGAEIDRTLVEHFALPLASGVPDAHRENLTSSAVFVHAGSSIGVFRVDAGMRVDHRASDRLLPRLPGFVSFVPDSLRGDAWLLRPGTEPWQDRLEPLVDCGGAATAAGRTNPVTGALVCMNNFLPVASHTILSPRIRMRYEAERLAVWGSVGSYLEPPNRIGAAPRDLSAGTTAMLNPGDTEPVRQTLGELGARFRTHGRSWIGAEVFHLDVSNPLTYRAVQYVNPVTGAPVYLLVARNGEASVTQGVEFSAQQEIAPWAGVLARLTVSRTDQGAGGSGIRMRRDPVQAAGVAWLDLGALNAPGAAGRILDDLTIHALAHFAEGAPYTLLMNSGTGQFVGRLGPALGGTFAEEPLSSRLPAQKSFDLRIAKGFRIAGTTTKFVADLRNPLGVQNVHSVFAETGTTSNAIFEERRDAQTLDAFSGLGANLRDMVIDDWTTENELNRHMLRRAEQRFGNGDGLYTVEEMIKTVGAYTALMDGPQWLRDERRELRLGVEIAF